MINHGVAATKGHLESNGGLRGHSVGDTFPFIVFASGPFDDLKWYVRAPNGLTVGEPCNTAQQAETLAAHYKTIDTLLK